MATSTIRSPVFLLLLLVAIAFLAETVSASARSSSVAEWAISHPSVLGAYDDDDEEAMEIETGVNRRGLRGRGRRFISYGALARDRTPCNRRGQSYYNCGNFQQVNPYRRGCNAITRCARYLY